MAQQSGCQLPRDEGFGKADIQSQSICHGEFLA